MQADELQFPFEVPIISMKGAPEVSSADEVLSASGNAKALIQVDMAVVSS